MTRIRNILIPLCIMAIAFTGTMALADTPPVPGRKADLGTIQKRLEQEKREQGALKNELKSTKNELERTREELVDIAEEARENEETLSLLEKRIVKLGEEQTVLTERLEQDYGSIADLILALERMRRIPPESLIVRPGAPLQTAQSAMLLQGTLPAVHKRAEQLSADLRRLNELTEKLTADKAQALAVKKDLGRKLANIQALTEKREKLYGRMQSDVSRNKQEIDRLSKEAKTLMDLIGKLESQERQRQASGKKMAGTKIYGSAIPSIGKTQLPVSGTLTEAYGVANGIGAVSRGITIETRPASLVTSPMGGVVRFTGTFKNYGNMVIIEHKDGYHSLVAGLHQINTIEGNHVKAGEPIGQLPLTSSRGGPPALYYELRYKGQPVDPAQKFAGLRS